MRYLQGWASVSFQEPAEQSLLPQDCAGVILYAAECATQVALDGIQCLGEWLPTPLLGSLSIPHSV